ncbi:MAG: glycosyltransferase family 4 protein [Bdellovibrionales bacterium]|nr:glycosyltransferase family 4 protein [Bdellovibrionales bacterium]
MSKSAQLPDELRICLVAERFPIIGRSMMRGFLWPIARGLAKAGHQVTVISWDNPVGESELEQEGVKAYFVAGNNPRRIDQFPRRVQQKFHSLHKEKNFHIVHSLSHAAYRVAQEKKQLGVAVAYDVMATKMAELFALIGMSEDTVSSRLETGAKVAYRFLKSYFSRDRYILGDADGVFVNSPQQELALERYYLYPAMKTYKIPYGIEIGDFSPRQGSDQLRQKLGIPKSSKVAVTVSDMVEKQDVINILRAFQNVVVKKPSSHLIIVGDGPYFKDIEFEMLNLALGSHVKMVGSVPPYEIAEYIDLANVFINIGGRTSGYEPSLLEAMIQEKVIIGSEVSPISTIVEDGVDGFLIRPADVGALSHLLLNLFLENISSEPMGTNARKKILDIFDTKKMVQETLGAYENILTHSSWVRF